MKAPRVVRRAVVYGVGVGLVAVSWALLAAMALGNKYVSPIPRNRTKPGDYV